MNMINFFKTKIGGYLDSAGKKKDDIVEKVVIYKNQYDEIQRHKKEDSLHIREAQIVELEKRLKEREEIIRKKEIKLQGKLFVRFIGIAAGISVIVFFVTASFLVVAIDNFSTQSAHNQNELTETKPYTPRESAARNTIRDIDLENPSFNVGKYCLNKEKEGSITFEECMGLAAAKAISKR